MKESTFTTSRIRMFQHTTVNRQTDNKTDNNRLTFTSITMDKVVYVGGVTGDKVWGCTGGNVWGIVTKVSRGIRYNDGSRRTGRSDDLERSIHRQHIYMYAFKGSLPYGVRNWLLDIGVGNLATVSAFSGRGRQSTESSLVHL